VDDPLSVHAAQVIRESSTVRGGLSEKVGEKKDTCSLEIDVWLGVESIEKRRRQRVPEGAMDFFEKKFQLSANRHGKRCNCKRGRSVVT
jgi:hypothetical protein